MELNPDESQYTVDDISITILLTLFLFNKYNSAFNSEALVAFNRATFVLTTAVLSS
jgi:hypothetical protein